MADNRHERETLALRVLWMLVLAVAWGVAETLLALLILAQLLLRLINGEPSRPLACFGDSLSRYLAGIGRFACFHSEEKPWPFGDWPAARDPEGQGAQPVKAPAPAPAPAPAQAQAQAQAQEAAPVTVSPLVSAAAGAAAAVVLAEALADDAAPAVEPVAVAAEGGELPVADPSLQDLDALLSAVDGDDLPVVEDDDAERPL